MAIACPPKMPWTTFPRTNVGAASRVSGAAFSSETRGSTTGATYSPTADFLEPNQQSRGKREAVLIIAARPDTLVDTRSLRRSDNEADFVPAGDSPLGQVQGPL